MREIIHISAGQCGNQIGSAFWDTISDEHGIDESGHLHKDKACSASVDGYPVNGKLDVYYSESGSRYIPRAVLVDLEPATLDAIRSGPRGDFYRPDNMVNALASAGNNWAKGYYTEGSEISERVMDAIRREVENTDHFQGFQLTHSLGGGTGSGLGSLLLSQIKDEYNDRILASHSVFPSWDSDTVVEPYNSVLALAQLSEFTDETFCLDNHALYQIFQNVLKVPHPSHNGLNGLIAKVMAGVTTTLRYPGQLNSDLRKLAVNLVPQSRLHFFTVGYSPLLAPATNKFSNFGVSELAQQALDGRSFLSGVNPHEGRYLSCGAFYRGKASVKEIEDEMTKFRQKNEQLFVDYIPDNVQTSLCPVAPRNVATAATFVTNTTAVNQLLTRIREKFMKMWNRHAFVHWYEAEGMERMEFEEASEALADLVRSYADAQDPPDVQEVAVNGEYEDELAPEYQDEYPSYADNSLEAPMVE